MVASLALSTLWAREGCYDRPAREHGASNPAARELRRLAKQSKQDSVRLRACEAIINLGGKLREMSELAGRIDALEKANELASKKTT